MKVFDNTHTKRIFDYRGNIGRAAYLGQQLIYDNSENYITFADSSAEVITRSEYGCVNDSSVLIGDLDTVTVFTTAFRNSDITQFPEIRYFTALQEIPDNAFRNCNLYMGNMDFSYIPVDCSIGTHIFADSSYSGYFTWPRPVITDYMLSNSRFQSVNVSNAVQIGERSFNNFIIKRTIYGVCTSTNYWDETFFPNLTTIGDYAFNGMAVDGSLFGEGSFYKIALPSTVTNIGVGAFGRTALTHFAVFATTPPVCSGDIFQNTVDGGSRKNYVKVFVPYESLDLYADASVWKDYDLYYAYLPIADISVGNVLASVYKNKGVKVSTPGVNPYYSEYSFRTLQGVDNNPAFLSYSDVMDVSGMFTNQFSNNTDIQYFNEFKEFVKIDAIPDQAFLNCTNLKEITLPSSLLYIGEQAFKSCSNLDHVIINHAFFINESAFQYCSKLKYIIILDETPPRLYGSYNYNTSQVADGDAFNYVFSGTPDCSIYVPSKNTYKNTKGWSNWESKLVTFYTYGDGRKEFPGIDLVIYPE